MQFQQVFAAKERKDRRDEDLCRFFFAIYAFSCGQFVFSCGRAALCLRAFAFYHPLSAGANFYTRPNQYAFPMRPERCLLRVLRLFAANQHNLLTINNLQLKPSVSN